MAASLFCDPPPDLSLTASNSTCTLLHPVCSLFTAISSLFSPRLNITKNSPFFPPSFSLCLLHPQSVFLTLFSSLFFFGGGGDVLERCSVTAKCLLRGAKKIKGEGKPVGDKRRPCCRLESQCTARLSSSTSVGVLLSAFLSSAACVCKLPVGCLDAWV